MRPEKESPAFFCFVLRGKGMRVALIGADGQLGSDLKGSLQSWEVFPLYFPEFDITKPEKAREELAKIKPEIVINTAAYNKVDDCEDYPLEAFLVNSLAVRDISRICLELDCVLVHFSSDYIFDGQKRAPYIEEDVPNPLSVYGISKLAGEYFMKSMMEKYFLIRTCGLYGVAGCWGKGYNFVDKMIELGERGEKIRVVNDQWITPTSSAELAARIKDLIQTKHYGTYHLTNEGQCTWYEFAQAIFSILGKRPNLVPVDSKTYGAKAKRPSYSVLENKRAKMIGLKDFSHWKDALKDYLEKKGYKK